jgi:hypothetical protein
MRCAGLRQGAQGVGGTLLGAGFVLVFTVPMVRIMIQSGVNANELASMPIAMARWVAARSASVYPFFAPTVGALGAFLAGSNTVSNLMLSQYQYSVATALGVSGATMVAAQSVGPPAGNMIAIHNVVGGLGHGGRDGARGPDAAPHRRCPRSTTWCLPFPHAGIADDGVDVRAISTARSSVIAFGRKRSAACAMRRQTGQKTEQRTGRFARAKASAPLRSCR